MKVGILTYHNNENKGAILQAYGLSTIIDKLTDCNKVEVIDYRTLSKEITRLRPFLLTKHPTLIPARVKDYVLCEGFLKSDIPMSDIKIITNSHKKAIEEIEALDYDVLVVGSDEVWKIRNKDGLDSILTPTRPFPSPYFLDPSVSATKVSYAASANRTDIEKLKPDQRDEFFNFISSFEYISVRDNYTEEILKKIGIEDIHRVPDPTLMTEIPSVDIYPILAKNDINIDQPILGIHTDQSPIFEKIANQYRDRGFQIVSPTYSPYADINLKSEVNPFEYYSLYDQFDMVVTSSLHSTIFSMKNSTPFVTVDVSSHYQDKESKTHSLLNDFSMLDRHYDAVENTGEELFDRLKGYEKSLNEEHISKRIASLQADGLKFLSTIGDLNDGS